jgi:hypothetical protein
VLMSRPYWLAFSWIELRGDRDTTCYRPTFWNRRHYTLFHHHVHQETGILWLSSFILASTSEMFAHVRFHIAESRNNEKVRWMSALLRLAVRNRKQSGNYPRELTQSILAKAFRGELVPTEAELARREGREYEPASVLLERIKAEREAQMDGRPKRLRARLKAKLAGAE